MRDGVDGCVTLSLKAQTPEAELSDGVICGAEKAMLPFPDNAIIQIKLNDGLFRITSADNKTVVEFSRALPLGVNAVPNSACAGVDSCGEGYEPLSLSVEPQSGFSEVTTNVAVAAFEHIAGSSVETIYVIRANRWHAKDASCGDGAYSVGDDVEVVRVIRENV